MATAAERRAQDRKSVTVEERFSVRMPSGQQPLARIGFAGARHLVPVRLPNDRRDVSVTVRVIDLNADAMDNIKEVCNIWVVFQRTFI